MCSMSPTAVSMSLRKLAVMSVPIALGVLADLYGVSTVYHFCSFLPAIGLLAWFLPPVRQSAQA